MIVKEQRLHCLPVFNPIPGIQVKDIACCSHRRQSFLGELIHAQSSNEVCRQSEAAQQQPQLLGNLIQLSKQGKKNKLLALSRLSLPRMSVLMDIETRDFYFFLAAFNYPH